MAFLDPSSDCYSASVPVIIYVISYNIGLNDGTRLYLKGAQAINLHLPSQSAHELIIGILWLLFTVNVNLINQSANKFALTMWHVQNYDIIIIFYIYIKIAYISTRFELWLPKPLWTGSQALLSQECTLLTGVWNWVSILRTVIS